MSRKINVNPGQYKTAGRERQGEDIVQPLHKAQLAKVAKTRSGRPRRQGPSKGR